MKLKHLSLLPLPLALLHSAGNAVPLQKRSVDSVPILSQSKSIFQAACGDFTGALQTQKNFAQTNPVLASIYFLVEMSRGNKERSMEILDICASTYTHLLDGVPIFGHIKGVIHYALGDNGLGDNCMKAATRTTCQAAGALSGGPILFIVATLAHDAACSVLFEEPTGIFESLVGIVKGCRLKSPGKIFDNIVFLSLDALGAQNAQRLPKKAAGKAIMQELQLQLNPTCNVERCNDAMKERIAYDNFFNDSANSIEECQACESRWFAEGYRISNDGENWTYHAEKRTTYAAVALPNRSKPINYLFKTCSQRFKLYFDEDKKDDLEIQAEEMIERESVGSAPLQNECEPLLLPEHEKAILDGLFGKASHPYLDDADDAFVWNYKAPTIDMYLPATRW